MMLSGDPLGDVLLLAVPLGIAGVFIAALFERIVPLLPSHGLFAAIGIAAAEGLWCLPAAMIASILGSGTGAAAAYAVGLALASGRAETSRVRRTLRRRDRIGRYLRSARRASTALPFLAQLLPAARLLAPMVAGATQRGRGRVAIATLAGLSVWNGGFMAIGYGLRRLGGLTNATAVSLVFIVMLGSLFVALRVSRRIAIRPKCL